MQFFCTKKGYEEWKQQMELNGKPINEDDFFFLTLREAFKVARMLFGE